MTACALLFVFRVLCAQFQRPGSTERGRAQPLDVCQLKTSDIGATNRPFVRTGSTG